MRHELTHPLAAPPRAPQVFRQADQLFVGLLNAIRCGSDVEARAALRYLRTVCQRPLDESDGIRPTVLFGRKAPVQARNERELAALPGDPVRACSRTACMQHACTRCRRPGCVFVCCLVPCACGLVRFSRSYWLSNLRLECFAWQAKLSLVRVRPVGGCHLAIGKNPCSPAARPTQ